MLEKIRTIIKQKGQGIVEYALLLAFVVGIGMMLSGSNLGGAVKGVFDDVAIAIEGNKYAPYFKKWHDKTADWLFDNATQEERLAADQEALARIARAFIGLDDKGVQELIKKLSLNKDGTKASFDNAKNYGAVKEGWSNTLVPLSYSTNGLEDSVENKQYIHLDWAGNVDTVKLLTNEVETYRGDKDKPTETRPQTSPYDDWKNSGVSDRIFYSNDMIGKTDGVSADGKMVTMKVHYQNGVVDQVNIQARNINPSDVSNDGNKNKNKDKYPVVEGLNLNVTKTEITPNTQNN